MKYKISVYPKSIAGIEKSCINTKKIAACIASSQRTVLLKELAELIERQHVWCPCSFYGSQKKQKEMASIQLFALDFDGGISIEDAIARTERYHIPIALYYETKSSVNFSRFRLVFVCMQEVRAQEAATLIQYCLCTIFPEADPTSKDFSKLYYPGRNVTYYENTCFSIYDLLLSTLQFLSETQPTNKVKKLNAISNKSHVVLRNNTFYIESCSDINNSGVPSSFLNNGEDTILLETMKNEEIQAFTIYHNMVNAQKSSVTSRYQIFFTDKPIRIKSERKSSMIRVNPSNFSHCQLLSDFQQGRRLCHDEWFGLMTNLIHLKGGQQMFTEVMHTYAEQYGDISRKEEQMKWSVKNDYHAMRCNHYCPYSDSCSHDSTLCYTLRHLCHEVYTVNEEVHYVTQEEMHRNIAVTLKQCMNMEGIKVIKAPTGAGKTYAYLRSAMESECQTIVAVPNGRLMHSIADEARKCGISCVVTPMIEEVLRVLDKETADEIRSHYAIGDDTACNYILRKSGNPIAAQYLKQIETIRKFKGKLVLTTHARLLLMKRDYLHNRQVIIDEDILPFMMQIHQVSAADLQRILKQLQKMTTIDRRIKDRLWEILSVNGYTRLALFSTEISKDDRNMINAAIHDDCKSDIYHALYAGSFYRKDDEDTIYFLHHRGLPECDCTVFTATADERIYRSVFRERLRGFYDMGQLRNCGQLFLHTDHTYSRDYLNRNAGVLAMLRQRHSGSNIITFKEYAEADEIYLGAAHGFNALQGMDLAVIGTFHRPEYVYKLWGMELGAEIDDVLAVRNVRRNGFIFPMMTYEKEFLRILQLWMIESETEQAVGRARLVRYDCTVHLYSNFPIRQGVLVRE